MKKIKYFLMDDYLLELESKDFKIKLYATELYYEAYFKEVNQKWVYTGMDYVIDDEELNEFKNCVGKQKEDFIINLTHKAFDELKERYYEQEGLDRAVMFFTAKTKGIAKY